MEKKERRVGKLSAGALSMSTSIALILASYAGGFLLNYTTVRNMLLVLFVIGIIGADINLFAIQDADIRSKQ